MLAGGGRRHAGDLVPAHRGRLVDALKAHAGTGLVVAWVVSEGGEEGRRHEQQLHAVLLGGAMLWLWVQLGIDLRLGVAAES